MPNEVVPQIDVGTLSIRGLAAFTPLLSALSADDVAPLTMVQLENLGSLFHVNGQYARMVPDLLRRCSSVRLDRIGIMIGWRKGDTASLFAQSAGGQAMALMSFCLANTCKQADIGSVLDGLSDLVLPKSMARSSLRQLALVADLLAAKMQTIGFGNVLAQQVVRIQEAYSHLDKKLPYNFFDPMTREGAVELFHALSKLSLVESNVLRISGIHAMAHITMVLLIMFPDNVTITTDTLIIQQGRSPSVFLDIDSDKIETTIQVEERLDISPTKPIIVETLSHDYKINALPYHFSWTGHITDALRIAFVSVGAELTEGVVEACCDLVLCLARTAEFESSTSSTEARAPLDGFRHLLGFDYVQRCYHICQTVFGAVPSTRNYNHYEAYQHLVEEVEFAAGLACQCTCTGTGSNGCRNMSKDWTSPTSSAQAKSVQDCLHRALWRFVIHAINRACCALLIDAGTRATTLFDIASTDESSFLPRDLTNLAQPLYFRLWKFSIVHHWVIHTLFFGNRYVDKTLAIWEDSVTLHCNSLDGLKVDLDRGFRYSLTEGQLHVKGRRYSRLTSVSAKTRQTASKPLKAATDRIKPSYFGEHSHVTFTVRETLDDLELRTTMIAQGHSIQLDLCQVIISSMGLNDAPECPHNPNMELSTELHDDVWTTSVVAPKARLNKIAIVQTKDNPTSQLLACEVGSGLLLQRRCCLDCAVRYAKEKGLSQIIVA